MEQKMNPDDYTIDISTVTTTGDISITSGSTTMYDTYTTDTVDLSGIIFSSVTDEKRQRLRDGGEIPVDIWAKLYNNGIIDD